MNQYVYQLSCRKPNDEKQKFIIESDTIIANRKMTEADANEMSKHYKCDIRLQYIGFLKSKKKLENPIDAFYYKKEDVESKLKDWNERSKLHANHQSTQPV